MKEVTEQLYRQRILRVQMWLLQSDRELRSEPCMEFYLNDPDSTEPEDLLTDICVPLLPK